MASDKYECCSDYCMECGRAISHNKELADLRATVTRLQTVLAGLPDDAIDGGWTAAGICAYAKQLEGERDRLQAQGERVQSLHAGLMENADRRYDEMYGEARSLQAEVAALRQDAGRRRKDTDRLNAIEHYMWFVEPQYDRSLPSFCVGKAGSMSRGPTLRTAIDARIQDTKTAALDAMAENAAELGLDYETNGGGNG